MRPLLAALLLAAPPALAQDLSDQLSEAARAFSWPGVQSFDSYDRVDDDPFLALLPSLEGDWTMGAVDPATGGLDPERLRQGCEEPTTLVQTSPRGFELRPLRWVSPWSDAVADVRFDYVAGHTFDRSVTEEDWIESTGVGPEEDYSPYFFAASLFRGPMHVFHPSPDVLVLLDPLGVPELFARCP